MVYADSSFLVSFYVNDAHSRDVEKMILQYPELWITPLNQVEIANAVWQNAYRGYMTEAKAQIICRDMKDDCENGTWHSTNIPSAAWLRCIEIPEKYSRKLIFRTLDALHVACALELKAERFWSFDERQLILAELCGLKTGV